MIRITNHLGKVIRIPNYESSNKILNKSNHKLWITTSNQFILKKNETRRSLKLKFWKFFNLNFKILNWQNKISESETWFVISWYLQIIGVIRITKSSKCDLRILETVKKYEYMITYSAIFYSKFFHETCVVKNRLRTLIYMYI